MAKIQDIVNEATHGSVGGFWNAVTGKTALNDLRKQYASSLSFVDPKVGIPDQLEDAHNRAAKRLGRKIWQSALKVAASGFGKGVLVTAGIILLGSGLVFGIGATTGAITLTGMPLVGTATATLGDGIAIGLAEAVSVIFSPTGLGAAVLGIGGALGAVHDVRKYQNKISEDIARTESENYARERESKRLMDLQIAHSLTPKKSAEKEPAALDKLVEEQQSKSFAAREAIRRDELSNTDPYRNL